MANWTVVEGLLSDGMPMRMYLAEHGGKLWAAALHDDDHPRTEAEFMWGLGDSAQWRRCEVRTAPDVVKSAAAQITEYFSGGRETFDLPMELRGTTFQTQVWRQLLAIPFGSVASYAEIAAAIGHEKAVRAVGNANGRNNLPVFVPCHRVIASGGGLGGFTGGIGLKKRLLAHESAVLARRPAA